MLVTKYENIIEVDDYTFTKERFQNFIRKMHNGTQCIG